MSIRRKAFDPPSTGGSRIAPEELRIGGEVVESSLVLDGDGEKEPIVDRREQESHARRVKHWQESPFAVGLVEPTWMEQRKHHKKLVQPRRYGDDALLHDSTGCLCCSAVVCPLLGAGRVGNMVVLRSTTETVELVEVDEETGEETVQRSSRPRLQVVMGPYWPMLVFVTYPLILGVSWFAFRSLFLVARFVPTGLVVVWTGMTMTLILSLAFTACSNPGILYRYQEPPPQHENLWRWSDQAQTWRPRNAFFDNDAGVVVEGFDHTYVAYARCIVTECTSLPFHQLSLDWDCDREREHVPLPVVC